MTNLNRPFFEKSGAFFTNYTFNENHLRASQELAQSIDVVEGWNGLVLLKKEEKSRKIYAGVDVFGRGKNKMFEILQALTVHAPLI